MKALSILTVNDVDYEITDPVAREKAALIVQQWVYDHRDALLQEVTDNLTAAFFGELTAWKEQTDARIRALEAKVVSEDA